MFKSFFKVAPLTLLMLALFATPALAGTIRYDVPESSAYTTDGNDTGVVKVEYTSCVVAGATQQFVFNSTVDGSNDGTATWELIGNTEPGTSASFDPPTVEVRKGEETVSETTLSFTPNTVNGPDVDYRIQLDGEPGLGNGPGIMVKFACIVPAAGTTPSGGLPAPTVAAAIGNAPCLTTALIGGRKLRAGERRRVRVRVTSDGDPVLNAFVRARGAGVRVTGRTNGDGFVTLVVRAKKKGKVFFQTNACAGADRRGVRAAFNAGGAAAPGTTG